jgi:hypothetical protein
MIPLAGLRHISSLLPLAMVLAVGLRWFRFDRY